MTWLYPTRKHGILHSAECSEPQNTAVDYHRILENLACWNASKAGLEQIIGMHEKAG